MRRYGYPFLCACVIVNAQEIDIINKAPTHSDVKITLERMKEAQHSDEELDVFDIQRAKPPFMIQVDNTNLAILYLLRNDTKALHEIIAKKEFDVFSESQIVLGDPTFTGKSYSLFSALVEQKRFDVLDAIFVTLSEEKRHALYLQFMLYVSIGDDMRVYHYLLSKGIAPFYANHYGDTTLSRLCQYGTLVDVQEAIRNGARIDTANPLFLQHALYGKKYDTLRYLLTNFAFDINMKPHDNRHFPSFLFYLVSFDSTHEEVKTLFAELLSQFSDATIKTYGQEFIQRLIHSNPAWYPIAMHDRRLKEMETTLRKF